jgi:hypothetical protein
VLAERWQTHVVLHLLMWREWLQRDRFTLQFKPFFVHLLSDLAHCYAMNVSRYLFNSFIGFSVAKSCSSLWQLCRGSEAALFRTESYLHGGEMSTCTHVGYLNFILFLHCMVVLEGSHDIRNFVTQLITDPMQPSCGKAFLALRETYLLYLILRKTRLYLFRRCAVKRERFVRCYRSKQLN